MAEVIVYSTNYCPYCVRAKDLLKRKKVAFKELDAEDDAVRNDMIKKAGGRRTVPQVFVNGQHVGGYDELRALDKAGKLDAMLGA